MSEREAVRHILTVNVEALLDTTQLNGDETSSHLIHPVCVCGREPSGFLSISNVPADGGSGRHE